MATTFLYRRTGGEVISVSETGFTGIDTTYFSTVTDPAVQPNGKDLAIPKIWDGISLRNATAGEIAGFATAQATDDLSQYRAIAKNTFVTDPVARKWAKALISTLVDEINVLRLMVLHPITSITRTGGTATCTTVESHGLSTGNTVRIFGASLNAYNLETTIIVTGATTFTYAVTGTPATPAVAAAGWSKLFWSLATATAAPRTVNQAVTAINNAIDAGTFD